MAGLVPSYIPLDLVYDILLTLPVKTFLRFQLVSKPVRNIITKQDFIKKQLRTSKQSKTHLKLILHEVTGCYGPTRYFAWDLDREPNQTTLLGNPIPLDLLTTIRGSCNGLLLLLMGFDKMALWNPFTRVYRILTNCPISPNSEFPSNKCGIGYDSVTEDYKVVWIFFSFHGGMTRNSFWIYSLKSNSWNRKDCPYHGYYICENDGFPAVFADGCLHWMVFRRVHELNNYGILSFDVSNETFLLSAMPPDVDQNLSKSLIVFEEFLCLFTLCFYSECRVYVRKQFGDADYTWTKMFTFLQSEIVNTQFELLKPLMYSKDSSHVLLDQDFNKLVWYDLEKKRGEKIEIYNFPPRFESILCWESLVSPA